jgi:hypothetical protein
MIAAAGVVVAACGLAGQGSVRSASCGNVAGGACSEQIDRMQQRHPGATSIDIECSAPVCDRRSGQGRVVITMPDGTTLNDTFAYAGDPNPAPPPACVGLAPDLCRNLATQEVENMPPSRRIMAIQVTCIAPTGCNPAAGNASVSITLDDGTTQATETGWDSAAQP